MLEERENGANTGIGRNVMKDKFKNQTLGKQLGTVSFFIAELMILVVLGFFLYHLYMDYLMPLIWAQVSIHGIVWGGKAASHFKKRTEE